MRRVIDGRTYNTETSKEIGRWDSSLPVNDFGYYSETLYRNTKGAYFLHGDGNAGSPYTKSMGQNSWTGAEKIVPLTRDEAQEWAERKLEVDEYEAEFGEAPEAESDLVNRERVNLTLDSEIMSNLRKLSNLTGTPMSQMVDRAILAMYSGEFDKLD